MDVPLALRLPTSEIAGFLARNRTPFVTGELLKPVSATHSTSANPASFNISRKTFPGIAPPCHPAQFLTMDSISAGVSPIKT